MPARGSTLSLVHSQGRPPDSLRVWLQLQTGETSVGYADTDIVDPSSFALYWDQTGSDVEYHMPMFVVRQTTTSVIVTRPTASPFNALADTIMRKDTGAWDLSYADMTKWDLHIEGIWVP